MKKTLEIGTSKIHENFERKLYSVEEFKFSHQTMNKKYANRTKYGRKKPTLDQEISSLKGFVKKFLITDLFSLIISPCSTNPKRKARIGHIKI